MHFIGVLLLYDIEIPEEMGVQLLYTLFQFSEIVE